MALDTKTFTFEVIDGIKEAGKASHKYILQLRAKDKSFAMPDGSQPVVEKTTDYKEYHQVNPGQMVNIPMYSSDGQKWFFQELEARLVA